MRAVWIVLVAVFVSLGASSTAHAAEADSIGVEQAFEAESLPEHLAPGPGLVSGSGGITVAGLVTAGVGVGCVVTAWIIAATGYGWDDATAALVLLLVGLPVAATGLVLVAVGARPEEHRRKGAWLRVAPFSGLRLEGRF